MIEAAGVSPFEQKRRSGVSHDPSHDSNGEDESTQALAKIQHSRADDKKPEAKPDHEAAIVADPRKRLADGKTDPVTKERKPATE
jgi:hypothetical protein